MSRQRPADRFGQLVAAAARIFVVDGYRRTQMRDVAEVLGVAKGTVYGYVESKAALLGAALRYADGVEPFPAPDELPVRAPAPGELEAVVAERLRTEVGRLRLVQALSEPATGTTGETLAEIITDLYRTLGRHRMSIKLIDRCAAELPELGEVWFGQGRAGLVATLAGYLQRHADRGALRLPGPAPLVARTILETSVLWAVHLHWDPAGDQPHTDQDTVAATLAGLLTRGLLPATRNEGTP